MPSTECPQHRTSSLSTVMQCQRREIAELTKKNQTLEAACAAFRRDKRAFQVEIAHLTEDVTSLEATTTTLRATNKQLLGDLGRTYTSIEQLKKNLDSILPKDSSSFLNLLKEDSSLIPNRQSRRSASGTSSSASVSSELRNAVSRKGHRVNIIREVVMRSPDNNLEPATKSARILKPVWSGDDGELEAEECAAQMCTAATASITPAICTEIKTESDQEAVCQEL